MKVLFVGTQSKIPCEVIRLTADAVKLVGNIPQKNSGFYIFRDKYDESYDYTDYTTIYRVDEDGVCFSNNGDTYEETHTVRVVFDDENDAEEVRPDFVDVAVFRDGVQREVVRLNESNNWKKEYTDGEISVYSVEASEVDNYSKSVNGCVVTYVHKVYHREEPSLEERVTDLEDAMCEIVDALM